MDSFYGAPRQPPTPPAIDITTRIPAVPEVSVIDNSFLPQPRTFKPSEFGPSIRPQHPLDKCLNRDALCQGSIGYNSSLYKKQVRFKRSPPEANFGKENVPHTFKTVPDLNGKTFKQIYMANVPDRHLDLSIFEPPRPKEQTLETSYDLINLGKKCNDNVKKLCNENASLEILKLKAIENTTERPSYRDRISEFSKTCEPVSNVQERYSGVYRSKTSLKSNEICTQTEPETSSKICTDIATPSDEPTIKDLFRIIQKQNEQIMLLQRQVNNLKTSIRQPEIDASSRENPVDMQDFNSPTKKSLFSFDVKATSFEFSFRPPQKFRKNEFLEPKIQEIVECDNSTENQNHSLRLNESFDVKDSYVSNVPSIAIEMDEYNSSDDDEEPEIGLTFYKDLMSQVNKVLKKAQKESECQTTSNKCQDMNGQAMKAVQQATLQHLKNIGVNLSPIQESSEVTGGSNLDLDNCNPSEISCAVQQLLMKYLPPEKLSKLATKPRPVRQLKEKKLKPTNELSFATLQYMKKYNLIQNTRNSQERDKRVPEVTPKILDVTALKLQPKLL